MKHVIVFSLFACLFLVSTIYVAVLLMSVPAITPHFYSVLELSIVGILVGTIFTWLSISAACEEYRYYRADQ